MRRCARCLTIVLSASVWLQAAAGLAAAQAEPVAVPGTKVRLVPPAGFGLSSQFPGFAHQGENGASILVTEMPGPFSQFVEGFTPERLAPQNMRLLEKRDISTAGKRGLLIHLRQQVGTVAYVKWIVVLGTENETVFIAGTCPDSSASKLGGVIEKAVLSAEWNPGAPLDPLAGYSFTLGEVPGLKFAQRVSDGMLLTPDGTLPGKPTNGPFFIVGSSLGQPAQAEPGFAENLVKGMRQLSGVVIKTQASITIGGLAGSEIVAEGVWSDRPAERVVVYQVLLPDVSGYFRAVGFVEPAEQQRYLGIFRSLIRTFRKK